MQNKQLEQTLKSVTSSINEEVKQLSHTYRPMSSDLLLKQFKPFDYSHPLHNEAFSQVIALSSHNQLVDFTLGMINKAYTDHSAADTSFFKRYKSVVHDYSTTEHTYARTIVEDCSVKALKQSNPTLFTMLALIVNHYSAQFKGKHKTLLLEANIICLAYILADIQHNKLKLKIVS
ncbi:hypothetical protein [Vibrio aestuarianus]|uniref:Uncharacterized protein n=1 Tax=Vibrio aestuarianus TaxID=28171 RepID=A0ABN8TP79_9VIBR|nr:hypothetical protein [Vibrio aestuarianus]MDE1213223.1 hypothetical protein [Vibrio aestuarianus]MDE1216577.1 hypothetical protein [Vibrio aestuarianus]MDE1255212.1 hypothetical protein [Vibrio aestuarianus]MDE1267074.1 hypothetical protein [Vibrio aestuarianus]MDE1274586.1 hypothetical protein [Vibrio aestuarianus]